MKKIKFLIMSESYNPNIGGYVVLHKLCDELNKLGYLAKLVPAYNNFIFNKNNLFTPFAKFIKERVRRFKKFQTNPNFITPIANSNDITNSNNDWIAIYPETISGNPLKAKHVIRWFLHHPGFHNKTFLYGIDELYFKYHSGIIIPKSLLASTSELELRIVHYPLDLYNMNEVALKRKGTAYAIRKGGSKKLVHNLEDSILIDGKSHHEISRIFKTVKTFYSYDPYTAYSTFAALCGCDSVVIPDEGVEINHWLPNASHRAGIAYGEDAINTAREERSLLIQRVQNELSNNTSLVKEFIEHIKIYLRINLES